MMEINDKPAEDSSNWKIIYGLVLLVLTLEIIFFTFLSNSYQ